MKRPRGHLLPTGLLKAAEALAMHFRCGRDLTPPDWFQSVGIGKDCLYVYCTKEPEDSVPYTMSSNPAAEVNGRKFKKYPVHLVYLNKRVRINKGG